MIKCVSIINNRNVISDNWSAREKKKKKLRWTLKKNQKKKKYKLPNTFINQSCVEPLDSYENTRIEMIDSFIISIFEFLIGKNTKNRPTVNLPCRIAASSLECQG